MDVSQRTGPPPRLVDYCRAVAAACVLRRWQARLTGQTIASENAVFGLEEVRIFSVTQWCQLLGEAGFSDFRVEPGKVWSPVEWAEVFVEARASGRPEP